MSTTLRKKVMGLIAGIGILGVVVVPGQAQAITFTFGCTIPHPPSDVCDPLAGLGVVTLTEVTAGPRSGLIDIDWNLTPAFGATLERMFLNFQDPFVPGRDLYMVTRTYDPTTDPVPPTLPFLTGTAIYGNNTQAMGEFGFDITLTPLQGTFPLGSVGQRSLVAFNRLTNPDTLVPLSEAAFNVTTVTTPSLSGSPPLLAGYRTNVLGQGVGEFWAGTTAAVAEPSSLLLLGAGLVGLGALVARRRAAGKKPPAASMGL